MKIIESKEFKLCNSENYNYVFNKANGMFARWGKTKEDDPDYSPFGPEILDIEISTICHKACSWCYKSNTAKGTYMSLDTFKKLFKKFPRTVTQVAFGIGDLSGNPELKKIMSYCRVNGIIPNITINGEELDIKWAHYLKATCGAVAVSHYDDNTCFNAIKLLTDRDMKQVNIHQLLCEETYQQCMDLVNATKSDSRLANLNAIVFLWLKNKGTRNTMHQISKEGYTTLVNYAFEKQVRFGFDSCSCNNFLKVIKDRDNYKTMEQMAEPCESCLFSFYVSVDGRGYPCSFSDGEEKWKDGIDMLKVKDFVKDVWYNKRNSEFRKKLLDNKRSCPLFSLDI